jgi:hypothetical protein
MSFRRARTDRSDARGEIFYAIQLSVMQVVKDFSSLAITPALQLV